MKKTYTHESSTALIDLNGNSFIQRAINGLLDYSIIEIISLKSCCKNKGHATKLLNMIANEYDDYIIVLKAEPMFDTIEDYNNCTNFLELLYNLEKFYKNRGFYSINDYIGYSNSIAMCLDNKPGRDLINIINKL